MGVKNLQHGTITLSDATGAPVTLEIAVEEGNLAFTESHPTEVVHDRGILSQWAEAQQEPVELSFGVHFVEYLGDASGTPREFMEGSGAYSANVTTGGASEPYQFDIDFLITSPDAAEKLETISFTKVRCEKVEFAEGSPNNTLQFSGRALMTKPTSARAAQA